MASGSEDEAVRELWQAAIANWGSPEDLFDSSTAYPGAALRGKDLWRIGLALGLVGADVYGYPAGERRGRDEAQY